MKWKIYCTPHYSIECFPSVRASFVFCVWPIFSAAPWIKLLRVECLQEVQSATSQLAPSCFQTEPFQIGFHKSCQFTGTSLENLPLSSAQPPGGVVAKEKVILNLNLQKGSFYKPQGGFRGESEGSWGERRVRVVGGWLGGYDRKGPAEGGRKTQDIQGLYDFDSPFFLDNNLGCVQSESFVLIKVSAYCMTPCFM